MFRIRKITGKKWTELGELFLVGSVAFKPYHILHSIARILDTSEKHAPDLFKSERVTLNGKPERSKTFF